MMPEVQGLRTISRRNQLTGQWVAEFRRGHFEELAEAQIGEH